MRTYYTQKNAQHYNRTWRSFLEKALAATISHIEMTHLDEETDKRARPIRILDAACGTGLLLAQLARLMPRAELYGVDASQAMLTQAADLMRGFPFPWKAFEWAIKLYDPQHVRLYTCSDAQSLCRQAQFQVLHTQVFPIDLFCQGWALLLN